MLELLRQIDSSLLLFVNSLHCAYLDNFMMIFSGRWVWVPLYLTLFYALVQGLGLKRGFYFALLIGAVIAMSDQLCASLIRPMIGRLRPSNLENPLSEFVHIVDGYRGGSYGFPSCHATNTFALATCIAQIFRVRRLSVAMFIWAIVNCYSRMYLGVHYLGDLVVGALIGMFIAWALLKIIKLSLSIKSEREIDRMTESIKTRAGHFQISHIQPVDLAIGAIILTSFSIAIASTL